MFLQKVLSISQRFTIQLQTVVSMNRRRFIDFENNFNLDLTYILDRIVRPRDLGRKLLSSSVFTT